MKAGAFMPPKLFHRFFRWYCHPKLVNHIEGDLLEVYGERLQKQGKLKADMKFIIDVLLLFRRGIVKPTERSQHVNNYGMFKNYFIIGYRNLLRNRAHSTINILGLALGISCCLLLSLYVLDEVSYDKHHHRSDDVYRITTIRQTSAGSEKLRTTSVPVASALRAEIPEVESSVRILNPGITQNLIQYGDKMFYETDGCLADSTLFDVLTYNLLAGDKATALNEPNSVVISERLAKKLFGEEPALGKQINISQIGPAYLFRVTGVFKEEFKTHIVANFFLSMTSQGRAENIAKNPLLINDWAEGNFIPTYVKLVPGHDRKVVEQKMNALLQQHGAEQMQLLGIQKTLVLEPIKDFYLKTDAKGFDGVSTNTPSEYPRIIYTYVVASIAIFILLIACINFINLSTAKATKRAGEIGIRKVMGAMRTMLVNQIMTEAMMITGISVSISILIAQLALPYFNLLTGKSISFGSVNILYFIGGLLAVAITTGIIAGSYPAFYLSSFHPALVLKGKLRMNSTLDWLRRSLIVFQFMISIALVCCILVMGRQLNFMQSMNPGYNANAKVMLPLRTATAQREYDVLKQELQRMGSVTAVSGARYIPGRTILSGALYYAEGGNIGNAIDISRNRIDFGYIELLGIKLVAGRSFSGNQYSKEGERNVVVNETAARQLGFDPQQMVGQSIYTELDGVQESITVIGVMEDVYQTSPKDDIVPTLYYIPRITYAPQGVQYFDYVIAEVEPANLTSLIDNIESTWRKLVPDTPFEYAFLDETLLVHFDEDRKLSGIISGFACIAMLISCLGLYGLSSYLTERRFKEIGIRKVLGASVRQIALLMSSEFLKLVLIAFALATPLAWYVMTKWLNGFTNKIPLDIMIFILAGAGALLIALLTVSFESIRAANSNPVESIKME